jgi:6,7-dimethyl-8-ribityllumazine synthase
VFGVVVKGDTYHFEQVADECARGCMNVAYDYEIPVIFQVLCVYKESDAMARTKGTRDNRGIEAGKTALEMIEAMKNLKNAK